MKLALLASLFCLAACGSPDDAPGPGGVTPSEAKALDDAAEMLESRNALPEPAADDRDGAADPGTR